MVIVDADALLLFLSLFTFVLLTSKLPLISPAFGDGLFVMCDAVLRALTGG